MGNIDIDAFYLEMGSRIKRARCQAGINQEELSEYLSLGRSSVANIEKGKQRPTIHHLLLLSSALKIQFNELVPNITTCDTSNNVFVFDDKRPVSEKVVSHFTIDEKTEESLMSFLLFLNK
ncbi:MAG: hypothetical protein BGO70_01215 [Bacteroidetes bacterium 43-93]|uniref:helix-turn-helix transcriptional regulator n=1 Tax=uncultured Dysgonomonas sp. TaxID=206096 RepID=UPI000928B665|nr:helix-turn-helix transcriptional regulator [uncultured Dysgonomonas sp.]MBN9483104.1 helix-turn-helix transcriptional regulator [Bacteroidota bacterium]OJW96332.1 MAG: hypothetical protein BGO70_01215 [Bacteroidetes bacterium 43-93]